jgi:hypothetical protein
LTEAEGDPSRRLRLILAIPGHVGAAALLVVGIYLLVHGLQPGLTPEDFTPWQRAATGIGAIVAAMVLFCLTLWATGRRPGAASLLLAGVVSAGGTILLAIGVTRGANASWYLPIAGLLAYTAAVASVRLVAVWRADKEPPKRDDEAWWRNPRTPAG